MRRNLGKFKENCVTDSRNEGEARPPADLDTSVAHPARVYDYWLGGKDNFAADREAAQQAIAANPTIVPESGRTVRSLGAP